jgi:hypothetical protein
MNEFAKWPTSFQSLCSKQRKIIVFHTEINNKTYLKLLVLDDNLWPVIAQHFPTSPYIFQEDNVPCHVSRRTNQWKTENDIPTLEWPPQSPDLNIIENVWKVIKTKVQRRIDDRKCWAMTGHKLSSKLFIYFSLFKLPTTGVTVPTVTGRVSIENDMLK